MNPSRARLLLAALAASGVQAADNIQWLVEYAADARPATPTWQAVGAAAGAATVADGALRLRDDAMDEQGHFRASFRFDPDREIVVDAKVRVTSMASGQSKPGASAPSTSIWPFPDGAPITLVVGDGRREGGIVLKPDKVTTLVDRVALLDTRKDFRTYRLVIRGPRLGVSVDGVQVIQGEGAFARPARSPEPFVLFGSDSKLHRGDAQWASVKLGLREPSAPPEKPKLRLTFSAPWDIPPLPKGNPHERPYAHLHSHTRPYLYALGDGLLLMSVAQGPDAVFEPYGVLRSTDAGRTWEPVAGLQYKSFAPLPFARLPDRGIVGVSRWATKYEREDGVFIGMTYHFDAAALNYTMTENLIRGLPPGMGRLTFDRHLFALADGALLVAAYGSATKLPGETTSTGRRAVLLRSEDRGLTWNYFSTLGPRPEPSVVRFSATEMMSLLRVNGWMPFEQSWSSDGGRTWTPPRRLEEGSVDADLVFMSSGVLACSYGRPGSNLMFSLDRGQTWVHHQVITEVRGYNYTSLQEVSPGRLLYVHDAPRMQALYVDVARVE
jgi:photosystem II stability/assembly factor-like uncharacterized protein